MMKKHLIVKLALVIVVLTFNFIATGQTERDLTGEPIKFNITDYPPGPEASALGRFDEVPANKATGVANISIPLFDIHEGGIHIPISLSYHAGGIKVQDEPSWVGLGWALSTGGIISRTVRGRPDEFGKGFLQNAMKVPHTTAISFGLNHDDLRNETHGLLKNIANGNTEFEPDLFHYSFGDKSGSFMFGNDMNIYTIPYNGLKIEPVINASGGDAIDRLKGFIVFDDDGVQYFFGNVNDLPGEYTEKSVPFNDSGEPLPPPYVSSWRLQKIINPFTDSEFAFYYTKDSRESVKLPSETKTYQQNTGGWQHLESTTILNWTAVDMLFPDSIVFGNRKLIFESEVEYNYRRLLKVEYIAAPLNENLKQEVELKYAYFGDHGNNESTRLRLDTVLVKYEAESKVAKYFFDYNNSIQLPRKDSENIDHYGFFNGANNQSLLPYVRYGNQLLGDGADRDVNHNFSGAGMISRITYPTGGHTDFIFEGNHYRRPGELVDIEMTSATLCDTAVFLDPAVSIDLNEYFSTLIENDSIEPGRFVLRGKLINYEIGGMEDYSGYVRIFKNGNSEPLYNIELYAHTNPEPNANNVFDTLEIFLDFSANMYSLEIYVVSGLPETPNTLATKVEGCLEYHYYEIGSIPDFVDEGGGGQRIKRLEHYDPVNDSTTIRTFEYVGYNTAMSLPKYLTITRSLSPGDGNQCTEVSRVNIHSAAHNGLGSSANSVAYSKVTEFFGTPENNTGKKESFFLTATDDHTGGGAPFFGRLSYQWKRSLLNSEVVFSNNAGTYDTVHFLRNYYGKIPDLDYKIRTFKASRRHQNTCISQTIWHKKNEFYYDHLDYWLENLRIDSVMKREYFYNSSDSRNHNIMTTWEKNYYDNPLIQIPSRVVATNSDGVTRETSRTYPSDYSLNDCYEDCMGAYKSAIIDCDNLTTQCMTELSDCMAIWATAYTKWLECQHENYLDYINHPIHYIGAGNRDCFKIQKDYLIDNGYYDCLDTTDCPYLACYTSVMGAYQICREGIFNCIFDKYQNATDPHEKALYYLAWFNLRNKPGERSIFADDEHVEHIRWNYDFLFTLDTMPMLHSIEKYVPDEGFFSEIEILEYDQRKNVIHEKRKQDGQDVSFIWGANYNYPLAIIQHAVPGQVFYEGFEEHPDGEIFFSNGIGLSKSGRKALNSGNFTFPAEFQPPAGVRLSYWYYQNNKWNYYEGEFTQVINSGGTWLDEIRVFPSVSLMITYAFDGFDRLVSSTDERNITTYYQYDHLGRLVLVRDDNGDILKQYEYNYAN